MVDPEELQWQVTVLSTTFKAQFTAPSPVALTTQCLVRRSSRTPCVCAFQHSGILSTFHPHGVFVHFVKCSQCRTILNLVLYTLRTIVTQTRLHFRHVAPVFDLPKYYYLFLFTFMWPCIVTNFFLIKPTDAPIFKIYFVKKLYMFRAVPLPIIRSPPLYIRHWYMSSSFDDSFQARLGRAW